MFHFSHQLHKDINIACKLTSLSDKITKSSAYKRHDTLWFPILIPKLLLLISATRSLMKHANKVLDILSPDEYLYLYEIPLYKCHSV